MDSPATHTLQVWCLGEFGISLDGGSRLQLRPKVSELLILLLLAHGKPSLRSDLEAGLWPDAEREARKTNLRTHLTFLRQSLGAQQDRIVREDSALSFDMTGVEVDAFRFRATLQRAKQTTEIADQEHALSLYTDSLLPFSDVRAIVRERARLQDLYLRDLESLAERLVAQEQREQAIPWLWRALAVDPLHEKTIGFMLHLLENDIAQVEQVMATYHRALEDAIDRSPAAHLEARYWQICAQHQRNRLPTPTPQALPTEPRRHHPDRMPSPLQPLLGREEELERIRTRLAQEPFVTLIGVGGVGKTRLVIEAARRSWDAYRDGVVFVDLAALPPDSAPEAIAEAIAASLEIVEERSSYVETVVHTLETQHLLLVLDTCEHLAIGSLGLIRTLRKRCPRLNLLATSRKQLARGFGEVFRIPPLPIPALSSQRPLSIETLRGFPAVQLFENTIRRRHPEFEITEENRDAIVRLCRATDGLPLAIQLLASGASLALADPSKSFAGDPNAEEFPEDPAVPERSRTMLRSIAWSCQMLSPAERELFYGVAIFAGGWNLQAAGTIFGDSEPEAARVAILLEQLRAASLVEQQERPEGDRYSLLKPLQEYALQCLQQSPAYTEVAQRHLDYYLEQVEDLPRLRDGVLLQQALRTTTGDLENLRAALEHGLQSGQSDKALRLAAALARFWYLNGRTQEGQAWLDRVMVLSAGAPIALRRRVLHGAGILAYVRDDQRRARAFWSECLKLSQEMGDSGGIIQAQGNLGNVALAEEDYPAARVLFESCLEAHRDRNDGPGIARGLSNLAMAIRGEGNGPRACTLHAESIVLFRAQGDLHNTVLGLNNLADTLIFLQRFPEAHAALADGMDLCLSHENPRNLAHCLTNYVMLATAERLPERAALLMGADETLRATSNALLPERAQPAYQQVRRQLLAQLGTEIFTALHRVGAQADLPTLHAYAKSQVPQENQAADVSQ